MFEELLKVKKVREQSAVNAVTKARNALNEASRQPDTPAPINARASARLPTS